MLSPLFTIPITMIALSPQLPAEIHIKIFPHLHNLEPMGRDADPSQVTLKSPGSCKIYGGNTKSAASSGVLKSSVASLSMTLTNKSLMAPLWFECEKEISVIRKGAHANYAYSGGVYAFASKTGPELIEVKPLNEYLKGVVPSEMPHEWPSEALKAQAVAARTYATFHILDAAGAMYDVDDTVQYQAYLGNSDREESSDAAVEATGSEVLTYDDKIIQAYFSADAGGYTEDASRVWSFAAPYCVAKPEIYANAPIDPSEWGPWTVKLPLEELNRKLVARKVVSAGNPVSNLHVDPKNKDQSGRVISVTLELRDGSEIQYDGRSFHVLASLRSTLFDVSLDGGDIDIHGRGFGHGVGMSQYGARVLAQLSGWDHEKILSFYYSGIRFCEARGDARETVCH